MAENTEMIVRNDAGVIEVFPKWPAGKPASFTDLPVEDGFEFTSEHDGTKVLYIDVKSAEGGQLRIKNPWRGHGVGVVDEKRRLMERTLRLGVVTFTAQKGGRYHITIKTDPD